MYPPNDETENEAFEEASSTANSNKKWADDNVAGLNDWLADHIEPHSVSTRLGHSGYSVKRSSPINNRRRHLVMVMSNNGF